MRASKTADLSDEALVRLTLERGSQYFGNLVKRHSDYLFGLGMRLSGGQHALAKDLTQQAFLKAFKYIASFNPNLSSLGAEKANRYRNWLTGIAVNCYSDLAKVEAKYVEMQEVTLDWAIEPERFSNESLDEFSAMIRPLSVAERQLVTLRYIYEYNVDEIAGMLNLKQGTVKSKISRAVAKLRDTETPTQQLEPPHE